MSRPRVSQSRLRKVLRLQRRRDLLFAGIAVGIAANGLRLRERLTALPELSDSDLPVDPEHVFLTGEGVALDEATQRAASAYARAHDLAVLDLVPGDLRIEQALELARLVDPVTYRTGRLVPGRGAFQATLVERSVLERAEIDASEPLDPVTYLRATSTLKRFAPTSCDLAVAPQLESAPEDLEKRLAFLRALCGEALPVVVAFPFVEHALLAAGLVLSPPWGAAALAAYTTQPAYTFSGTPVRPRDLARETLPTRFVRELRRHVASVRGTWRPPASVEGPTIDDAAVAAEYEEILRDGINHFFEARRDTCPRCTSSDLRELVRTRDLLQAKPGEFVLDECGSCQHVFQNPRLSIEGLDFYYRDFYDGLGEQELDALFSISDESYRGRVDMVRRVTRPKRWLDVGAGHGHFCLVAAGALPDTRFDGLDLSDGVDEAAKRGWIEEGYRGLFPDVALELAGGYDVVSMHHYLEHTREPWDEIDAARLVLEPGGHLLIEVPDPDSKVGRRLGWLWGPWFQPQHQHFLSVANLSAELEARGFTVVDVERGEAHQPCDFAFALWLLCNRVAPDPPRPWLPQPTRRQKLQRLVTFFAFGPFLALALVADRGLAPVFRRLPGGSNTYRLLARRD